MMKKYWQYIKCTLLCRFNKDINVGMNTKIKWIKYAIKKESGNKIIFENSSISHCCFRINGFNNKIVIDENAKIVYCSFSITGDNNVVHIKGSAGTLHLTVRGSKCQMQSGVKSSMENCYMICMGQGNSITIGDDCMFSGGIELWNSDTHLITDLEGLPQNRHYQL